MKSFYFTLAVFFFTSVSIGQSRHDPKFRLTSETMQAISIAKQLKTENQNNNGEASGKEEQFINFNKVISLKFESDYASILMNLGDLSQLTVFTVYEPEDPSIASDIWKIYGEDSFVSLSTNQASNSDMHSDYESNFNKEPVLNTYTQMYKPKNKSSFEEEPHMLIGSFNKNKELDFKGSIAEILVFNKVLRGKKKQIVETTLALKYGITLTNSKDYLSSSKKKIYNLKDNSDFIHRIAGIGRDDKSNLFQKQSHSTKENSLVTIGLGSIASTNEENKETFNNQTFIIWGDNNQEPIIETKSKISQVSLMQRVWKVQVTGDSVSELSTSLEFDASSILSEEKINNYLLVIDPDGDGDFISEKVRYIDAITSENNIHTFNNIKWDEDGSGSDSFTFALKAELELTFEEVAPLNCKTNNSGILSYQVNGGMPPYHFQLRKDDIIIDEWESTNNKYANNHIKQLSEGEYNISVTDVLLTKLDVDYTLIKPNSITIDLGEDRRLGFNDDEILLDASLSPDEKATYIWTSNNGFSSNSSKIRISEPGLYTVTVTTEKGCSASDTINIQESIIKSFIVYPNQSRDGNYNIQIKLSQKEDVIIKIFDMVGRHISTIEGKNQSMYSIPGKHISTSGVYNVILESASQNESRKLVVD